MPVITEEDEENESYSETGTDEIMSNYWRKAMLIEHQGVEPLKNVMVGCELLWCIYLWHVGEP